MESRPSVAALSPEQRASPARLQAMADIASRTLQGTVHRRLHLVPGAHIRLCWPLLLTVACAMLDCRVQLPRFAMGVHDGQSW